VVTKRQHSSWDSRATTRRNEEGEFSLREKRYLLGRWWPEENGEEVAGNEDLVGKYIGESLEISKELCRRRKRKKRRQVDGSLHSVYEKNATKPRGNGGTIFSSLFRDIIFLRCTLCVTRREFLTHLKNVLNI